MGAGQPGGTRNCQRTKSFSENGHSAFLLRISKEPVFDETVPRGIRFPGFPHVFEEDMDARNWSFKLINNSAENWNHIENAEVARRSFAGLCTG